MTLEQQAAELRRFKRDMPERVVKIIEHNEEKIANMVRTQLAQGITDEEDTIRPQYEPSTIRHKTADGVGLGKEINWVTLYDQGDFHRSIRLDVYLDRFEVVADDEKTNMLQKKYEVEPRGKILGVTLDNQTIISRNIILPVLENEFERIMKK